MPYEYTVTRTENSSPRRTLKVERIDSKLPNSSTGLIDKRLFTGENLLHADMDAQTTLWSMHYDHGNLPAALNQRFTSFGKLKKFVDDYFLKRNIKITEVID